MTAVRVTREQRAAVVAAPRYLDSHPKQKKPRDITAHRCLQYRMGTGGPVYRWEFESGASRCPSRRRGPSSSATRNS